jgi:hypothetical protein
MILVEHSHPFVPLGIYSLESHPSLQTALSPNGWRGLVTSEQVQPVETIRMLTNIALLSSKSIRNEFGSLLPLWFFQRKDLNDHEKAKKIFPVRIGFLRDMNPRWLRDHQSPPLILSKIFSHVSSMIRSCIGSPVWRLGGSMRRRDRRSSSLVGRRE